MRRVARIAWIVVAIVWVASVLAVHGQEPPSQFEPVRPGDLTQEQLPAAPLVFAAYAFVWFALVSYVLVLWRRLRHVQRELADLTARIEARRP
jgi:CcmD family protein